MHAAHREEVSPEKRIEELRFRADSTFSVTWTPFETYKDYWGTYTYDLAQGSLDLAITAGNLTPDDVDSSGLVSFGDNEELVLQDMWLGRPRDGTGSAHCGHRFIRIR